MCGILTAIGHHSKQSFEKALYTLSHRGPDAQGIWGEKEVLMGHTRLSIIDLDTRSNQPMIDERYALVFNGEIYNFEALKREYALTCKTTSDTEVLIKLYEKLGHAMLSKLNGMFAFCLYDRKSQELFMARDRFGKKPLYFSQSKGLMVASEIKAILALLETTPAMNMQGFQSYFSFQSTLPPHTFFEGIHKLEAGTYATYAKGVLTCKRYYEVGKKELLGIGEAEALAKIEELLLDAVQKRLVGDVEVASLLSGGIDSSLVSSIYAKASGKKIHTFSIGYDEYLHYDELDQAKEASVHIGSHHHELRINKKTYIDTIENTLTHLDEPMGDTACMPTYLLSQMVHQSGIKVCLSGEGSDEIFLGYDNYFEMAKYYQMHTELSSQSKMLLKSYLEHNPNLSRNFEYLQRITNDQHPFYTTAETFTHRQFEKLIGKESLDIRKNSVLKDEVFAWMSKQDIRIWIAEVLMSKIDRMSMAHSLELRAPFLDYRLVDYCLALPPKLRAGNTNKYLLKQIAQKYIPSSIIDRKKKGFSSPFIEWLYDEYGDEVLELMLRVSHQSGLFDPSFVTFLYHEGKEGRFKQHVWSLYLFCRWYNKLYL
ncbi:MAG: asparagine synthetase-like enzyme [Proteobacteria bacterium]|nr:asparagine synthetase-like enzyme [Pseudomonadota bacterium]